ncbi:MAG TPA: FAD-binding protein, partial [Candidatus Latescibacteria bacterium]|nr:FAD-binding protein [Candidatus Latescibacterota bacterium]
DGDRISGALGYWRESGRFVLYKAKAVVVATGGIGMAYKITSNSWEYTADGMALAYRAGAELIDMEFVQFHPTGMIWPPGVMGILVTEGVRGDGGLLKNNKGERFMFNYIPDMFRSETAETEEEVNRWLAGDKSARRTPDLLTRDVVARAILNEVKEGRGSEHGGAYLDISHKPAEYVKRKLPSMYMQFMELADVDITQQAMEVGPTTHYIMGGVRVEGKTTAATVPGLFAAGEAAGGLHGSNRLGGNSLSDLLVFGRLAGLAAAGYAKDLSTAPTVDSEEVDRAAAEVLAPFERSDGEDPFQIHRELRDHMQDNVGIIRDAEGLERGLEGLRGFKERVDRVRATGSRLFNPGWHLCADL